MQVCFDKLISDRPVAVHFNSKEEAEAFFFEMKSQYPSRVSKWSYAKYPYYDYMGGGGVCYCPYFNQDNRTMTHGSRATYDRHGIRVIEFYELLYDDSTEIAESVLPFEFLLN